MQTRNKTMYFKYWVRSWIFTSWASIFVTAPDPLNVLPPLFFSLLPSLPVDPSAEKLQICVTKDTWDKCGRFAILFSSLIYYYYLMLPFSRQKPQHSICCFKSNLQPQLAHIQLQLDPGLPLKTTVSSTGYHFSTQQRWWALCFHFCHYDENAKLSSFPKK